MPISDKENATTVKFGIGDIYMANFHKDGSNIHYGVLLAQDVPGEIGKKIETGREYSPDLHAGMVVEEISKIIIRLEFDKSKSVDQLIGLLKGVRDDLLRKEAE